MNETPEKKPGGVPLTLLLVFVVFAAPMVLAWLLANRTISWLPHSRVNYGTLVQPLVNLSTLSFQDSKGGSQHLVQRYGKWTVVMVSGPDCPSVCQDALDRMRRVRIALRQEMGRVRPLVLLTAGDPAAYRRGLSSADPRLQVWRDTDGRLNGALAPLSRLVADGQWHNRLLLVDYLGNAMMIYPAHPDMAGILKDLKRLLSASKTEL